MTRRNALLSTLGFCGLLAGYAALSLRTFYRDPAIRADSTLPKSVVEAMIAAEKDLDFLKPKPFSWRGALDHLIYPWDADTREVRMMWLGKPIPLPSGSLHPKADRGIAWIEVPGVGGVKGDLTHDLDGVENVRIVPPFEP